MEGKLPNIQRDVPTSEEAEADLQLFYSSLYTEMTAAGCITTYERHPDFEGRRYQFTLSKPNGDKLMHRCVQMLGSSEVQTLLDQVRERCQEAITASKKHLEYMPRMQRGFNDRLLGALSWFSSWAQMKLVQSQQSDRTIQLRPQELQYLETILMFTRKALEDWPQYRSSGAEADDALH